MPQVQVLNKAWRFHPPTPVALQRISQYLGMKPPKHNDGQATKPEDAMRQAMAAGLSVFEGKPDDPMLAFLDPPST